MIALVGGNAGNTIAREFVDPEIAQPGVRVRGSERNASPVGCKAIIVIRTQRDDRGALTPSAIEPTERSWRVSIISEHSVAGRELRPTRGVEARHPFGDGKR